MLVLVQDPLTPPTLLLIPPGLAAPTVLKHTPPAYDATGLVVTRHEAVSIDGERIPYVQSGPPGETGEAPVHLSGYGGFGSPRCPATPYAPASYGWSAAAPRCWPTSAAAGSSAQAGTMRAGGTASG